MKDSRRRTFLFAIFVYTIAVSMGVSSLYAQKSLNVEDIYGRWGDPNVMELDGRRFSLNVFMVQGLDGKWIDRLYIYDITDPLAVRGRSFNVSPAGASFRMDDPSSGSKPYVLRLRPVPGDMDVTLMSPGGTRAVNASGNTISIRQLFELRDQRVAKLGEIVKFPPASDKRPSSTSPETMPARRPSGTGALDRFAGTWVAPYNGGQSTLMLDQSGAGTMKANGTGGQKEDGSITNCHAQGGGMACDWKSTYSDADKTITRGGKATFSVNGDSLAMSTTVDPTSLVERWNVGKYSSAAERGGAATYKRK